MADDDGLTTTDTFHVPKMREDVEHVLEEKGFKKEKGSNQYIGPDDVSLFLTRERDGTEVVYMGPPDKLPEYEKALNAI